jgi:hypothetical protein
VNLFQISTQYQQLLARDEFDHAEMQALEQLQDNIEDKAISISNYILNMEAELAAVTHRQKQMFERATALHQKIDMLKEFLRNTMQKCNITKINKSPDFVISIKINPPSIHVDDEDKIPKDYFKRKETYTLDKGLIKFDIDKGIEVPGASLVRKTRLEIK